MGETVTLEVTPDNFGRIAAQTAKQVLIQKLRDAEADLVYNEYKDKVFQVVTGTVRQKEGSNIIIDLGRGEALLKQREQIENEDYNIGDRLKIYMRSKSRKLPTEPLKSRALPVNPATAPKLRYFPRKPK